MTETPGSARAATDGLHCDRLTLLVNRVAARDRASFRRLYAFSVAQVWAAAAEALGNSRHAAAVTRSTFVELWRLAGHQATTPWPKAGDWIRAVTARRIADRLRILGESCPCLDGYDRALRHELASLLGDGRAIIRVGPAVFTRIDHLDLALAALSPAPGGVSRHAYFARINVQLARVRRPGRAAGAGPAAPDPAPPADSSDRPAR